MCVNPRIGITQVWFAGSHCDIGGGYLDSGLSDITLSWMVNVISKKSRTDTPSITEQESGLYIDEAKIAAIRPNPLATLHDSSATFPFNILPTQVRTIPESSLIKNSVQVRMKDTDLNYAPTNLPKNFTWSL